MNVRDIMTADVPSLSPSQVVAEIVRIMLDHHLPELPVVDADGSLVGVVRAHDLVARHARVHAPFYLGLLGAAIPFQSRREDEEIRHALAVTAGDLMVTDLRTVSPENSIEDAATILVDDEVDAVPVINEPGIVGMVTQTDVLRLLLTEESDDSATGQ